MLELTSDEQPVHLNPGTSVQLEYNSPLFDEDTIKGAFSYSISVPALPNGPLYEFPERPDRAGEPGAQLPAELSLDGLPLLTGTQRVKSASAQKYSINLQAGLSGAKLSGRQLSSFTYGGLRSVPRNEQRGFDGGGNPLYVSGLTLHANEVVVDPDSYPYVFAPLRNEFVEPQPNPLPVDPLIYPGATVNAWYVFGFEYFGLPADGTFSYRLESSLITGIAVINANPPYCPFPRLRYVLQCIFEESGLQVDVAELLPGELGDLVIVSNAHLVDKGDLNTLQFSLADVLPALTVAELLAALRQDYGIVVYQNPLTKRVRSCYLRDRVAPNAQGQELTSRLVGGPEVTVAEAVGVTLTYHVDSEDELTKELLSKQPDAALVLPEVATAADLPTTAILGADNPQTGQARLVRDEGIYYSCTVGYLSLTAVSLSWKPLADSLPVIQVSGGGDEQAQATCFTTTLPTRLLLDITSPVLISVPALSQPPYRADQSTVARSSSLRLLFYNGLQLAGDGVSQWPQLSHLSPSGKLSVRLAGTQGTYEQLLKEWLPVKLRGTSYKQSLLLSALDLSRLDLTRQLWLDGVAYLVKKLSATVPLKKAATVELVRL